MSKPICPWCEREFERENPRKKYCSVTCRSACSRERHLVEAPQFGNLPRRGRGSFQSFDITVDGKNIKFFPDNHKYAVARDGTVYSNRTNRWYKLRIAKRGSRKQYCCVSLGSNNSWDVHRLVMYTFVGPCPEGQEVRHLDGDPSNNNLSNLAYGTRKQNMQDAVRHGTTCRGSRNPQAQLDEDRVLMIKTLGKSGFQPKYIANAFHVSYEAVKQILNGSRWGWLEC